MQNLMTLEALTGTLGSLTREYTLELRAQYIPEVCKLHFERAPMKVIRANAQYLYDDRGSEYLDCVNCVAHVGHCNPMVVDAAKKAMLRMGNISVDVSDAVSEYVSQLRSTFPPEIDTFLFVHSGSEANDLAIQMARMYTGAYDVVTVKGSFHGGITLPNSVSPRQFKNGEKRNEWVHVLECPDLYRGKFRDTDTTDAVQKYCKDAKQVMEEAVKKNRKLSCFICEPIMTAAGVILPPSEWIDSVYRDIRSFGGLTIADEAQSGLGRSGTSMWCFQQYENLVPDIITIGKPLGNGHPMACIATKSRIAATLLTNTHPNEYACDLVSSAVGLAVLKSIRSLSLQMNARTVGDFLREGIRSLGMRHQNIGEVRGVGLMIGVEIVYSQMSRKPARDIAEEICYKMLEHFIVVANDGPQKNILIFTPPMCFTWENAHRVIVALSKVLKEIENTYGSNNAEELFPMSSSSRSIISGERLISLEELVRVADEQEDFLTLDTRGIRPTSYGSGTVIIPNSPVVGRGARITDGADLEEAGDYITLNSFSSMD